MDKKQSTVVLSEAVLDDLRGLKIGKRQSYDEVVRELIGIVREMSEIEDLEKLRRWIWLRK